MAIKKTVSLTNNFLQQSEFPDCVIRVDSVSGGKKQIIASIGFYASQNEDRLIEKSVIFTPSMDGGNFIAQAYTHLKTLPEFSDAVDC